MGFELVTTRAQLYKDFGQLTSSKLADSSQLGLTLQLKQLFQL